MCINTTIIEETEDLYEVNGDRWVSQKAEEHGFPVAGFVGDIYEDAVLLIGPMFKFDWKPAKILIGRVIHVSNTEKESPLVKFVLLTEGGTQIPCTYSNSYPCYFALPEDSETFRRVG